MKTLDKGLGNSHRDVKVIIEPLCQVQAVLSGPYDSKGPRTNPASANHANILFYILCVRALKFWIKLSNERDWLNAMLREHKSRKNTAFGVCFKKKITLVSERYGVKTSKKLLPSNSAYVFYWSFSLLHLSRTVYKWTCVCETGPNS